MADTADNLPKGFNENPFCKSPTHKTVLLFWQLFFLRHASMESYATRYCQRNECFCGCFPYDGKWMHLADNALGFDAVVHWQLTCSQLKATVGIRYGMGWHHEQHPYFDLPSRSVNKAICSRCHAALDIQNAFNVVATKHLFRHLVN